MRLVLALSKIAPKGSSDKQEKADAVATARFVRDTLQALSEYNAVLVKAGRVPPLYQSGVLYRRECGESFQDALHALKAKWADCSNLAAWRAGELIAAGESAKIRVHWRVYDSGVRRFHITVRRADGTIEDPSRILGMQ